MSVERINENISYLNDKSKVSDGSHTFDELYYHRSVLFATILNANLDKSFKSKLHDDGTMFDDYFIIGIETPLGYWTYHDHISKWDLYQCKEVPSAPKWDGHSGNDVERLLSL